MEEIIRLEVKPILSGLHSGMNPVATTNKAHAGSLFSFSKIHGTEL